MVQPNISSRPLCVDLDGTLIQTDTMEDLLASFLRAQFWRAGSLLVWLLRGRAYFKQRLAREATLPVDLLPEHPAFLQFLHEQLALGRRLLLVSAADEKVVRLVAERFKIFSGVIGSDGKINLRGEAKLQRLTALFGEKGFDYAGNSSMDIPVWRGAAESIVVNARKEVEARAREVGTVVKVFPPLTGRLELWKQLWRRHRRISRENC